MVQRETVFKQDYLVEEKKTGIRDFITLMGQDNL